MAYTTPKTWSSGNTLTAADLNTYVRDNVSWLASDKPTARVRKTTNQSINTGTTTLVTWDAEDWDNSSLHSTVTNTSRLTVPATGKYLIGWYWYWALNVAGRRTSRLNKNGTLLTEFENFRDASAGAATGTGIFLDHSAVVGDYYEIQAFQSSGGALNIDAASVAAYFYIIWLGT